ncbi:hypothetical protein ACOAKC_10160 [Hathewaya histolytica]|uniref:hypothetical protein n=1 Tax=Hathewaya histolytica TaxID=1498 RepID=UPI003B670133
MKNKRLILLVSILILNLTLIGCAKVKKEKAIESNEFNIKSGLVIVENYMRYLSNTDYNNAKKLFTKELYENTKELKNNELDVKGYSIENISEVGKSALIEMKVVRSKPKSPQAFLDNYTIKVVKEGAEYKISKIDYSPEKEGFPEAHQIRQKNKNNVKTDLITEMETIPNYYFPKDDGGNISKISVSKSNFGPMQFSYSGEKIAISTSGENPYLGVISIEDSVATQGQEGGESGGGEKTQGQDENKNTTGVKEKPIGKEIVSLDILKGCKLDFMVFSEDGETLVCQYEKDAGKAIRLYRTGNGDILPIGFKEAFPIDKVDILFDSFNKESLNFEIKKREGVKGVETSIPGKYKVDLKELKISKL